MDPSTHGNGYAQNCVGCLLREGTARLAGLPDAEPRLEAELLLVEASGLSRERLMAWPELALAPDVLDRFRDLVRRRLSGEPMAYLRGRQHFWTLELRVAPDTLIPRPETELLVEIALEQLPADEPLTIVDAGTGSGAIAAALASERPNWFLVAVERCAAAGEVAAGNLRRLAPRNARLMRADWLAPLAPGALDAVVANPPYIADHDPHLSRGALPFEPRAALASGAEGLDAIRRIALEATTRLVSNGMLILEHGFDQGPSVRQVLTALGYQGIETRRDLAGLERATFGYRGHPPESASSAAP